MAHSHKRHAKPLGLVWKLHRNTAKPVFQQLTFLSHSHSLGQSQRQSDLLPPRSFPSLKGERQLKLGTPGKASLKRQTRQVPSCCCLFSSQSITDRSAQLPVSAQHSLFSAFPKLAYFSLCLFVVCLEQSAFFHERDGSRHTSQGLQRGREMEDLFKVENHSRARAKCPQV